VDEQRQPEASTSHAETTAWRVNGASGNSGRAASQSWLSHAGPQQSPEPPATADGARHRQQPAAGLEDQTPVSGMPTVEPPLWREAVRTSTGTTYGYRSTYSSYQPTPVGDLVNDTAAPAPGAEAGPPEQEEAPVSVPPADVDAPTSPAPAAVAAPVSVPAQRTGSDPAPAGEPGYPDAPTSPAPAGLPQRVPAEPDVPVGVEASHSARERWTAPELAWIADQLRRDDVPGEAPAEPLDVDAVLEAVREVDGVRSASVRLAPTGVHTLRLDLADDADPGQVSSTVARLLLERMGLAAAPQDVPQTRPTNGWSGPEESNGRPAERIWQPDRNAPAWSADADHDGEAPVEAEVASRPLHPVKPGMRVLIEQVQVRTHGLESTVEVRLTVGDRHTSGAASGPSADSYLVRLAAVATAKAIDAMLRDVAEPGGPSRCFVEHTGVVSFGRTDVAVVVLLLVCGGWVEQLTGAALVDGDPRQAVVRATLGAVNRRLEALLA